MIVGKDIKSDLIPPIAIDLSPARILHFYPDILNACMELDTNGYQTELELRSLSFRHFERILSLHMSLSTPSACTFP